MTEPYFGAVIRTQGKRERLLLEALESLSFQSHPCLAVVVVHANEGVVQAIRKLCESVSHVQSVVLHAGDLTRKRGYPINVGFDYLCDVATGVQYAFLLDDDDIVYPFFTRELLASFVTTGADVVYAVANRKTEGKPPETAFELAPISRLLLENFIPTNSYSIRLDTFRKNRVRADEQLEYLEDWRFLLALLAHGYRFEANPCTLCEFSLGSDGNQDRKENLDAWNGALLQIRAYVNHSSFPFPGGQIVDLLEKLPGRLSIEPGSGNHLLVSRLERRIADLERSWSWRLSAPVRLVGEAALRLRSRFGATHKQ